MLTKAWSRNLDKNAFNNGVSRILDGLSMVPSNTLSRVCAIRLLSKLALGLFLAGFLLCVFSYEALCDVQAPTVQGWQRMNALRNEWALPEISMPPFNVYLDEQKVLESAASTLDVVEINNFSSTYFVGTRVLKPLLIQALGLDAKNIADPEMEWNRWFSMLPAWGDYGTQKLLVLRKK